MADYIKAGYDTGGPRDYLDGEPINNGVGLDLWEDGTWKPGRYETSHGTAFFVYAELDHQGYENTIDIDRNTMRFRWPTTY